MFKVIYLLILFSAAALGEDRYLRVVRDPAGEPVALETSIVRFEPTVSFAQKKRLEVELISAVHVGDGSYYETLNERFKRYDAVLYELIAETGTLPSSDDSPDNPLSLIQLAITRALRLQFQLSAIDYSAPNFVHADMSPKEFVRSMEERDESFMKLFAKVWAVSAAKEMTATPSAPPDLKSVFMMASSERRAIGLRRMLAAEFSKVDELADLINGKEGSTVVSERNRLALRVLRELSAEGRNKFAIFFGAAHMRDFEQRLVREFSLEPRQPEWITAWSLSVPEPAPTAEPG